MAFAEALEVLVGRMHETELAPDAEQLADALWLASHLPGAEEPGPPERLPDDTTPTRATDTPTAGQGTTPPSDVALAVPGRTRSAGPATLGPESVPSPEGRDDTAVPTRVPAAAVLPDRLALQRALQPLNRYQPPSRPVASGLDEVTTAERAADTGIVDPVQLRTPRRQARLQLVMDISSSTVVWRDTFDELHQVCERAGAFRGIQKHYVHQDGHGEARVAPTPEPTAPTRAPGLLRDPSGRQLTVVLSDCAGPLWRGGRMQRLLYAWASCAPVAVVQPLPQRMWRGTRLPAFPGELHRREGPTGRLEFRSPRTERPFGPAAPVPVLALRPTSLSTWVRLVCDDTAQRLIASAAWVRPDHPAGSTIPRADREFSSRERVRGFRRTASRDARLLAEYLATVPLVLPVMQLVQRAMLPDSGPEVMAEVLLAGLVRSSDTVEDGGYEFIGGAREELLRHLPGAEARLVLKHSSQYLERQYGRSARNFPALAAAYLANTAVPDTGVGDDTGDQLLRAFAQVSSQVLARYGRAPSAPSGAGPGELTELAYELLDRYSAQGNMRDLDEGIGTLRRALRTERRQSGQRALRGRLAQALLQRWLVARTADNLLEAYEALPTDGKSSAAEVLTEADILLRVAAELEAAGAAAAALPPGLADDLDEPGAGPVRLALLAYEKARRRLEEGMPPDASASQGARAVGLRATAALRAALLVVREGADVLGPDDGSPAEWAAARFERAAHLAAQNRLHEYGSAAVLFEARALLAFARHDAGRGDLAWEPDHRRRARAQRVAGQAAVAFRDALQLRVAEGAEPRELARMCLDIARALELTSGAGHDPGVRQQIVDVLNEALGYAGDDLELRSDCFDRLGAAHHTAYGLTRVRSGLESAVWAWWQAAGYRPLDDPARPPLLYRLGLALHEAQEWNDAVRVLRMAVNEVFEQDPELFDYRVALGDALLGRHIHQGGLSDLHEASWILGTAARETDNDLLRARAWELRGETVAHLAVHTTQASDWQDAADQYWRAVEILSARGETGAEARVRAERAAALVHASAPARVAAAEYRTALRLYGEAGFGDSDAVVRIQEALVALESQRGDDI